MTAPAKDKRCEKCGGDLDTGMRCVACGYHPSDTREAYFPFLEPSAPCPAFLSRDAEAKQKALIEAVKGLVEAAELGLTVIATEHPEYGLSAKFIRKKIAAVEKAMKEVEK